MSKTSHMSPTVYPLLPSVQPTTSRLICAYFQGHLILSETFLDASGLDSSTKCPQMIQTWPSVTKTTRPTKWKKKRVIHMSLPLCNRIIKVLWT